MYCETLSDIEKGPRVSLFSFIQHIEAGIKNGYHFTAALSDEFC